MNGLEKFKEMRDWIEWEKPECKKALKKDFDYIEQELKCIPELEAKAKAFDVLKACVDNVYGMQLVEVEEKPYKNDVGYIAYALKLGGLIVSLSKEQYEILKKAGV